MHVLCVYVTYMCVCASVSTIKRFSVELSLTVHSYGFMSSIGTVAPNSVELTLDISPCVFVILCLRVVYLCVCIEVHAVCAVHVTCFAGYILYLIKCKPCT